ncbi:MAG: MSHA biogenesis protein MshI [Myxococcota bacterium]
MFDRLFKKPVPEANGQVGLTLDGDGFSISHVVRDENGPPKVLFSRSLSNLTGDERQAALREIVAEENLTGLPCVVTLPRDSYRLQLLDRPKVEDHEIVKSLQWLVKEVIDFDPGEATLDYCVFPEDASRGRSEQIFVAAARNQTIEEASELVHGSGLELCAIDVAEFAMRNLIDEMPKLVAGTLLLDLGAKDGLLAICHEAHLYFGRRIGSGTSQIDDAMSNVVSLDDSPAELSHYVRNQLDELLLEIQRSLDYYESELGKAPASRLVIAPSMAEISAYIPYLAEQLRPVKVSQLDINELVDSDALLGNELQAKAMLAVGGALRKERDQEINLNRKPTQSRSQATFSIERTTQICALVAFGLIAASGASIYQNHQLAAELAAHETRQQSVNRQFEELENQHAGLVLEGTPVDPLASLKGDRNRVARTLRSLENIGGDRREGFSKYFSGFARQIVPELWLTRIEVLDGGDALSIHGHALSPKRVPQLLRRLREEESFSGKTFSLFRLDSNEKTGRMDFSLESQSIQEGSP